MKKVKNSELLLSYIREGKTMTQREKLWLIASLSIPSILAQISATVMFFIDASMVGHLGAKASAAIGLVESTGWLMGGLASAANMGFSVQVAHFIGANDFDAARRVLRQSLVCSTIWALITTTISLAISPFLPYWLGGSEEIVHDASVYFAIFGACGIFFQMEGLAGSMLKCSGNMKIPSLQLPIYIYTGTGSDGSSHRNRTGHADNGRTDAVFPVGEVEDALTGQSSRVVQAQVGYGQHSL